MLHTEFSTGLSLIPWKRGSKSHGSTEWHLCFEEEKGSKVSTDILTRVLFECPFAKFKRYFGILVSSRGWKLSLKILVFFKQLRYFENPQHFESLGGLLGNQLTPKNWIWTFLTNHPWNGDPRILKKVPRVKNFWFSKSPKWWKTILVLCIFS